MSTHNLPTPTTPPKRIRKRLWIPSVLLLILALVGVGFYVRGTWAGTQERNPESVAEGTVTQLLRKPDGTVVIRCAIRIKATPKQVWAVVTDYNTHNDFIPYASQVTGTHEPDGRWHVVGVAHSRIWGDWPFDTHVVHLEDPAKQQYQTSWDEQNDGLIAVNRGGWQLSPIGDDETLLVYTLQVEVPQYPAFVLRNIVMDRLHSVLKAVRAETQRRAGQ
jgi:ribosome-associated toxin RatA of RatAB toxin-antitoxin module